MAIGFVVSGSGESGITSVTTQATGAMDMTGANTIIVSMVTPVAITTHSISDTESNTYSQIGSYVDNISTRGSVWISSGATVDSSVVVSGTAGTSAVIGVGVMAFSGVSTSTSPVSAIGTDSGSPSPNEVSVTPASTDDWIISCFNGRQIIGLASDSSQTDRTVIDGAAAKMIMTTEATGFVTADTQSFTWTASPGATMTSFSLAPASDFSGVTSYGTNTLNANHRWSFNNVYTDSIGNMTIANTGGLFSTTPITRDATHAWQTNGRDDLCTVAPTGDTGTTGLTEYSFQGWFQTDGIQGPPCMIYKQGGNTSGFALFLWGGNNVMLQVKDTNATDNIQLYSDIALTNDRSYHFFCRYSGSGGTFNEIEFYIDGVKQTLNNGTVEPGAASMTLHTGNHNWGENGSAGTDVNVGDETVLIKAPINGFWAEWWTWFGSGSNSITEDQINNDLFGAGAIPEFTVSGGTQAAMQATLDTISGTTRGDVPLAILVEAVSLDGDVTLTANDIVFDDRGSIDVRYEGNGQLTWINGGTSNADRGSTINQDVLFVQEVPITITVLDASDLSPVNGARVLLEAASGGTETVGTDLLAGNTDVDGEITSTFNYSSNQPVSGKVRKGTSSIYYKTAQISDTITSTGLDITVLVVRDE